MIAFQVMFFMLASLVGIILGALLAALGLVFDQKEQIEAGGMVTISSSLHRSGFFLWKSHKSNANILKSFEKQVAGGSFLLLVAILAVLLLLNIVGTF